MTPAYPTNADIADALQRIADLLAAQGADIYRVGAYRRASRRIAGLTEAVALLLAIDARYRHKAAAGQLETIAPRRFNPEGEAYYSAEEAQA